MWPFGPWLMWNCAKCVSCTTLIYDCDVNRTGQAVGALMKRLKLKAQGYVSAGEVRLTVIELLKWLNPKPTATTSTIPLKNPFAFPGTPQSMLAKTIADQQRAIRLGTSAPPMRTIDMLTDMDTRQGHFQQPDEYGYSYDIPPTRTYRKPSNSSYWTETLIMRCQTLIIRVILGIRYEFVEVILLHRKMWTHQFLFKCQWG